MIDRTGEIAIQRIYNFIDMKEKGVVYTNGKDFYKVISNTVTEVYHQIYCVRSDPPVPGGVKKGVLSQDDMALLDRHVLDMKLKEYLVLLLENTELNVTISLPENPTDAYCDSIYFGGEFEKTKEYLNLRYRNAIKSTRIPASQENLGLRVDSNGELKYVYYGNSLEYQNEKSDLLKYDILTIHKAETLANSITEKSGILFKADPSGSVESIYICKR